MIVFGPNSTRRALVAALALIAAVAGGALVPHPALAGFSSCVSDPTVILSNGATLDLQAQIGDSASDVRSVVYTVHVPAGTGVVGVVKTGGILGTAETVRVYADDPARTYDTSTVVYTGQTASVTALTTAVSALDITLGSTFVSGTSGQVLASRFSTLL